MRKNGGAAVLEGTKELRRSTRLLPCKLNETELNAKGQELAQTVQEIAGEEIRQKGIKDQLKARLSELQSRQSKIALVVTQREEYRDVVVVVELREDGTVQERRLDTEEVMIVRPMKDEERQLTLEAAETPEGEEALEGPESQGKKDE